MTAEIVLVVSDSMDGLYVNGQLLDQSYEIPIAYTLKQLEGFTIESFESRYIPEEIEEYPNLIENL